MEIATIPCDEAVREMSLDGGCHLIDCYLILIHQGKNFLLLRGNLTHIKVFCFETPVFLLLALQVIIHIWLPKLL